MQNSNNCSIQKVSLLNQHFDMQLYSCQLSKPLLFKENTFIAGIWIRETFKVLDTEFIISVELLFLYEWIIMGEEDLKLTI